MKAKILLFCCFAIFIDLTSVNLNAQPSVDTKSVYIHTDRAYYAPGENVNFKAYILDKQANSASQINDTLHIALIDIEGIEVSNGNFPIQNSLLSGKIELPDFLTEGSYMLIATTGIAKNLSPANMFSKIIEIRNSEDTDLSCDISFTDSIYHSGSELTAHIKISGLTGSVGFNYQLTGTSGETPTGKEKTNGEGTAILKLQLPVFDNHQVLKLLISPLYKNTKKIYGIVIPTNQAVNPAKIKSSEISDKHLNIQVSSLKQVYAAGDKVQVAISVTDDKGQPAMANLSVSASNWVPYKFPLDYNNIIEYTNYKTNQPTLSSDWSNPGTVTDEKHSIFDAPVRNYYAQSLINFTQIPGRTFVVQEKNNIKKLHKKQEALAARSGYSTDLSLADIIMQIKPYHLENGKINFGMGALNSFSNQDGALIVVDGVKMGSDVSILTTIPVIDIAHITVSTNSMDIQKYSALNSVGVIEITTKKSKEFTKEDKPVSKGNTLFWEPDMIVDNTGKKMIDFLTNEHSKEVLITVNGINGKGVYGCTTIRCQVAH
jgi:hypothetical protein